MSGPKTLRNVLQRSEINRDVFSLDAISSGRPHPEDPFNIGQRDSEAVYFWLDHEADLCVRKHVAQPLVPGVKLLVCERIPEAQHGLRMPMRSESRPYLTPDGKRRRVRRLQLRIALF